MNSPVENSVLPNLQSIPQPIVYRQPRAVMLLCLLMFWCCAINHPQAIEMTRLYVATVMIADQSIDAREDAHESALKQVFVRASGSNDVLTHQAVKNAIKTASRYVVRYQYLFENNQQLLLVEFDQQKVNQLLRQNDLNIWGTRRPQVLIWYAQQKNQSRVLLGEVTTPKRLSKFNAKFMERGLPVVFPLLDLDDVSFVSVSDVWGRFDEHIAQYSARYPHDEFILARQYSLNSETSVVDWVVYEKGKETCTPVDAQLSGDCHRTLEGSPEEIEPLFADSVSDYYAAQYAVTAAEFGGQRQVILPVYGVDSLPKMMEAEARLESFSSVFNCQVYQIQGSKVVFKLSLLGEVSDVYDALELDSRFKRIFDPLARPVADQPREYRWLR